MNLIIDIGNTEIKLSVFNSDALRVSFLRFAKDRVDLLEKSLENMQGFDSAIMLSSGKREAHIEEIIKNKVKKYIFLDFNTKIPIKNCYLSPETLGMDRLAAAVGAWQLYEGRNVMIVDFGTAITIDLLGDKGEFLGGNISLGLNSRYRALRDYTFCLPLLSRPQTIVLPAGDTKSAIESGVLMSVIFEIEGYINYYSSQYNDLVVVLTGGDASALKASFNDKACFHDDLVARGLNKILEYNAD